MKASMILLLMVIVSALAIYPIEAGSETGEQRDWLIVLPYSGNVTDIEVYNNTIYATGVLANGTAKKGFLLEVSRNGTILGALVFGNNTVKSTAIAVGDNKLYLAWSEGAYITLNILDPTTLQILNTTSLPAPNITVQTLLGTTTFYGYVVDVKLIGSDIALWITRPYYDYNFGALYYLPASYVFDTSLNPKTYTGYYITYFDNTSTLIGISMTAPIASSYIYILESNYSAITGKSIGLKLTGSKKVIWFGNAYMPSLVNVYTVSNKSLIVFYDYGYYKLVSFVNTLNTYLVSGSYFATLNNTFIQALIAEGVKAYYGGNTTIGNNTYLFIASINPLVVLQSAPYVGSNNNVVFTWTKIPVGNAFYYDGTVKLSDVARLPVPSTPPNTTTVTTSYSYITLNPIIYAVAVTGGLGGNVSRPPPLPVILVIILAVTYLILKLKEYVS